MTLSEISYSILRREYCDDEALFIIITLRVLLIFCSCNRLPALPQYYYYHNSMFAIASREELAAARFKVASRMILFK